MTDEPVHPLNVFYSYSHKDAKLRDELGKHLFPLKRQGFIVDWYDRDISAGKEWEQEIDDHLNTAHTISCSSVQTFWPRSIVMASS